MNRHLKVLTLTSLLGLTACATGFVSSWKAPDATPLELRGAKVAAVVMMKDQAARRSAEDTLASEITARGGQGVAMYTLLPDAAPSLEAPTRSALENAGVLGIVAMRPISVDKKLNVTPVVATMPRYRSYWGGYYAHGWASPWAQPVIVGTDISEKTVVSVETLVYSLKQDKLVWSGTSKTTSPPKVQKFVKKLAAAAAAELGKQGLIQN